MNWIGSITTRPSAKNIGIVAGVLTGAAVAVTFDLPAGVPRILAGIAAGVPAGFITYDFVLNGQTTDDPVNNPTPSEKLVGSAMDLLLQDPAVFIIINVGFVAATVILYDILLSAEVDAVLEILPVMRRENVSLFLVLVGTGATFVFAGIAGWTVEVILWAAQGGHLLPDSNNQIPAGAIGVPARPGARHNWGWLDLPKDLVKFLFAFPLAIYKGVKDGIHNKSLLPILTIPLVTVLNQWHRVGDIIVDVMCPPPFVKDFDKLSKSFLIKSGKAASHFLSTAVHDVKHILGDDKFAVGADTPVPVINPPLDSNGNPTTVAWSSFSDNPYGYPEFTGFQFSQTSSSSNPTGKNMPLLGDVFDYIYMDYGGYESE